MLRIIDQPGDGFSQSCGVVRRHQQPCRIVVNDLRDSRTARTVTCSTCSVALDPITVLDQIARDSTWVQVMRAEKKRLVEQIAALKHEVSLVKQQRRRVGP